MSERLRRAIIQAIILILGALIGASGTAASVRGCRRAPPAPPPPETPPTDPTQAIGVLVTPGGYCSATAIVGPSGGDQTVLVTAAHCVGSVGQRLSWRTRSGAEYPARVSAVDRRSDCAILHLDSRPNGITRLVLAASAPRPGDAVWHAGFGVDKPGNTERGVFVGGPTSDQQLEYRLSVSPGDSGGGIIDARTNELLSPVCCTTCLGCTGRVWGASPDRVRSVMTSHVLFLEIDPCPMPQPKIPKNER
jgi:hypothetical protein